MTRAWIHEAARPPVDEDGKIMEHLFGKAPDVFVSIYDDAVEDGDLSAQSGRPRFRNVPMISVKNRGERDFVSVPLTDDHLRRFPRAAAWWRKHKGDAPPVSVQLLPGITPAEVAELEAMQLHHVEALCESQDMPEELAHWKTLALRLRSLTKPRLRLVDGEYREVA
ncbi:MAG TPA: hypothetical protein PK306_22620 [Aquabacterium sp.]|nr:hypothetical protein [Aquabacterium sp.]